MQAVVLVGGLGTRLRPLTLTTPKPLVPLANRPVLAHILRWLQAAGVAEVILATQYGAEAFRPFLEHWRGVPVQAVQEPEPLGTAGAVRNVRERLHGTTVVVNGDNMCDLDLHALLRKHRQSKATATIAIDAVDDPTGRGVVVADDAGHVGQFQEKPAPGTALAHTVNTGTYVIEPEVLDQLVQGQPAMWETDLFPALIRQGMPVFAALLPHHWLDVGTPDGYFRAHGLVLSGTFSSPPGEELRPQVWVEDNVSLSAEAWMDGGVTLGFGATVAAGARVHGPVMLGRDVHVLPGAHLTSSAIWDRTLVERDVNIDQSIVGYNCYIGAGAQLQAVLLGDGCVVRAGMVLPAGTALAPGTTV